MYLKGCNREELLESTAKPEEIERDEDKDEEQREERVKQRVETTIWNAVSELAANSQEAVRYSGVWLLRYIVRLLDCLRPTR